MRKVLIVRSSSMGDVIHALPMAYDVAQFAKDIELHWLVEKSFVDIPRLSPYVKKIHVSAFRKWRKNLFSAQTWKEISDLKKELVQEKFDYVLDIQGLLRSGLVSSWAKVETYGYKNEQLKEIAASIFYDKRFEIEPNLHAVERYRKAVASVLYPRVELTTPRFGLIAPNIEDPKLENKFVSFAINTSRDSKLWPEDNWVELGLWLRARGVQSVLFWGSEVEKARCDRVARRVPGAYVVDKQSLYVTAGYLARSVGLVGVDTGLSHLGAALGVASIGIFVSTPPELLRLVGEGAVASFGGVGIIPSPQDVIEKVKEFFDLS